VGLEKCVVLRVVTNGLNNHGRPLPITIDHFERCKVKGPFADHGRKVILLHDNARPHVAKATQEYIFVLAWELLSHAAYSPDMTFSDYYVFRSLQHHLADTHFVRFEQIQKCINDFIASKLVSFSRQEIRKPPKGWQKIVDANREYFAD